MLTIMMSSLHHQDDEEEDFSSREEEPSEATIEDIYVAATQRMDTFKRTQAAYVDFKGNLSLDPSVYNKYSHTPLI